MGKMSEIKEHLKNGKSVKEIVELGFKKPSIYKCRKELEVNENPNEFPKEEPESEPEIKETFHEEEHKETSETVETILDNNNTESDNSNPNNLDNTIFKEEEEPEEIIEEIFESDDVSPFQQYDSVGISRHGVNIDSVINTVSTKTNNEQKGNTGKIGLPELLAEVYGTIAIITGHDHWSLQPKDQKVIKHLCKLPGIEKFLHKFGLYGCILSLFTITVSRIKQEIKFSKEPEKENDESQPVNNTVIRSNAPANIMEGITYESKTISNTDDN